jgi:hypothetical protein
MTPQEQEGFIPEYEREPDDSWDDFLDEEECLEAIGSCGGCSVNLYEDDYYIIDGFHLCGQCAWYAMGCPGPGD